MPHLCIVLSNVFVFGAQWALCNGHWGICRWVFFNC